MACPLLKYAAQKYFLCDLELRQSYFTAALTAVVQGVSIEVPHKYF